MQNSKKYLHLLFSSLLQSNKHLPLCFALYSLFLWYFLLNHTENLFWVILSQLRAPCSSPPPIWLFRCSYLTVFWMLQSFPLRSALWSPLPIFHCLRKRDGSYQWKNTRFLQIISCLHILIFSEYFAIYYYTQSFFQFHFSEEGS